MIIAPGGYSFFFRHTCQILGLTLPDLPGNVSQPSLPNMPEVKTSTWSFTQSFLLGHLMIGFRSRLHQNLQSITMTIAAYCRGPPFRLWKPVCLSNPCQLCLSLFEKCPQCLAQNNLVDCRQPRPHLNWSLETVYGFAQTWCIPKLAMFMRNMLIKITGFWGARCLDKPVWLQTTHTYFEYIPGILSVREHAITCHNHIVPQFWWDITS